MTSPFTSITKLANTRVLVIGGTSGIGFAVAAAALEHGASIIVSSSQSKNVDSAIARLRERYPTEYSGRITGFVCDLGNQDTVERNVVELLERATSADAFSGKDETDEREKREKVLLDHIAFTAGDVSFNGNLNLNLSALTVSSLQKTGTVRYMAPLFIAKYITSYIKISPSSSITLTSGTNTAKPQKGWTVLAALGASVEAASRGLAVDLAPIRVNTVSPGVVLTELFGKVLPGPEEVDKLVKTGGEQGTLVGRVGRPEDVAEAYVYCMKDGFVDGVVLGSDGGRMMK